MNTIVKIVLIFLALTGAATLLINGLDFEFGQIDFWQKHGVFFLIFITLFPRLTLLFSSVAFGGVLWWLGFIFAPRFLVAVLATISYWQTNPILVVLAWLLSLGGESTEKYYVTKRSYTFRNKGDAIEAEFSHRN